MKRVVFLSLLLIIFSFGLQVNASSKDQLLIDIINEGEITESYLEELKKENIIGSIRAESEQDGIITIHLEEKKAEEEKTFYANYTFVYSENDNIYTMSYLLEEKEQEEQVDAINYMRVMPFYGVEISPDYSNLKKLLQDNALLPFLRETFDRCYMAQMGVCFTDVTKYKAIEYIVKIEMNDKAYQYALKQIEQINEKEKEKALYNKLFLLAFILLILIMFTWILQVYLKKSNKNL